MQGLSLLGSLQPRAHIPKRTSSSLWLALDSWSPCGSDWCYTNGYLKLALCQAPWRSNGDCLRLISFSGNARLLIIQMFIDQNAEHTHTLSSLYHTLVHLSLTSHTYNASRCRYYTNLNQTTTFYNAYLIFTNILTFVKYFKDFKTSG